MHICLVTLDHAPYRSSGLAVYGEQLANALLAAGHQVTVVAALRPGTKPDWRAGGLRVVRVPIGRSNWLGYAPRAARTVERLARAAPFDRVHFVDVHFAYAYRGAYTASLLQSFRQRRAMFGGPPTAASALRGAARAAYYRLAELLEARSARRARALLATSAATRDEFAQLYQLPPATIPVIGIIADLSRFRPLDASELRAELGLHNAPTLVYAGFSTPRKGVEYLAEALKSLPQARLVIIGRWEAGYRELVVRRAGDAWGRVVEVGYVSDEEMPWFLALGDIFVLPSLLEGFGIPLVEAMACGLPIVTTAAGSIPEVAGDAALIVPPRDSAALADALRRLLQSPALRAELRERGLRRVRAHFAPEVIQAQVVEWFEG